MSQTKIIYDFFDASRSDLENNTVFQDMYSMLESGEKIQTILKREKRWEYYYHLSPIRENVIDLCRIEKTDTVLEIGAQAGALTGAIARRCAHVDCVTKSDTMAKICELRHSGLDNITIFAGELEHIAFTKQYDVITLFGALETAPRHVSTPNPYLSILQLVRSLLKPGGRLYIGCNNRFGLRYFAGYYDEQTRKPFGGIAGGNRAKSATTFSRYELIELLEKAGFAPGFFYYPFPDYAFAKMVYSDDHFPKITAHMDVNTNYINNRLVCFDENKVYPTLNSIEERKMFANSFVVEVTVGEE